MFDPTALGKAIDFEAMLSVDSGTGVVGAMFAYDDAPGTNSNGVRVAFSDEIDFEYAGGNTNNPNPYNDVLVSAWHDWQRLLPSYAELPNPPYYNGVNNNGYDKRMPGIDRPNFTS